MPDGGTVITQDDHEYQIKVADCSPFWRTPGDKIAELDLNVYI